MKYSNPETVKTIQNWPLGGSRRGIAMFYVEIDPNKGQRACRRTIDPVKGPSKPKAGTYTKRVRFVDGDDGRTYVLKDHGGFLEVQESNLQYVHQTSWPKDPEHAQLMALFDVEEAALER